MPQLVEPVPVGPTLVIDMRSFSTGRGGFDALRPLVPIGVSSLRPVAPSFMRKPTAPR